MSRFIIIMEDYIKIDNIVRVCFNRGVTTDNGNFIAPEIKIYLQGVDEAHYTYTDLQKPLMEKYESDKKYIISKLNG